MAVLAVVLKLVDETAVTEMICADGDAPFTVELKVRAAGFGVNGPTVPAPMTKTTGTDPLSVLPAPVTVTENCPLLVLLSVSPVAFAESAKLVGVWALMAVGFPEHMSHPALEQVRLTVPLMLLVTWMICAGVVREPAALVNVSPVLGLKVSPFVVPPFTVRVTVTEPVPPNGSVSATVAWYTPVASELMFALGPSDSPSAIAPPEFPRFTSSQLLEVLVLAV